MQESDKNPGSTMTSESSTASSASGSDDGTAERPRFAIGHLGLSGADVEKLARFYVDIGMRPVVERPHMAIIELLGGTHIIISSGPAGGQQLDLIVDDIDEAHAVLATAGGAPGEIRDGSVHRSFVATDPEGNQLSIHSTHAIGPV